MEKISAVFFQSSLPSPPLPLHAIIHTFSPHFAPFVPLLLLAHMHVLEILYRGPPTCTPLLIGLLLFAHIHVPAMLY